MTTIRKSLIIALIAGAVLLSTGCQTGDGNKVGQIIKLNKQGIFCDSYEAELIRGGINNGSGASSTLFDFTVEDEALLTKVQDAIDGQYEVKIKYRMDGWGGCSSDSGGHYLTSIEKLEKPGHAMEVTQAVDAKEEKRKALQKQLDELK